MKIGRPCETTSNTSMEGEWRLDETERHGILSVEKETISPRVAAGETGRFFRRRPDSSRPRISGQPVSFADLRQLGTDKYGEALENNARFLLEAVRDRSPFMRVEGIAF